MVGGVRKGAWTEEEDSLLRKCIEKYGEGKWHQVPLRAGLNRCRKSCRLRWLNYLRPNIKRGNFSGDEVDLIIRLHNLLGNRWSLIAGRLPGRTANDVKNYWNTHQSKKCKSKQDLGFSNRNPTIEASTTTLRGSKVLKPRPRIFIKHNNIPLLIGDNKSNSIIPNTNNHGSFKRIPSNQSIQEEGFSSSPTTLLENNNIAMELFDDGLFQNELWTSQYEEEELMKRFWSQDITTFLAGNNENGVEGDGDSKNKDKEKTILWDNDVNESAIDMDIWELLGYTQDHVVIQ